MIGISLKALTYFILFTVIGMCGSFMSDVMESIGCPQRIRNVIYCSVISILLLENWSLLADLKKYEERHDSRNLARRGSVVHKQPNVPINTLEATRRESTHRVGDREDITTAMNAWIIYCNTENAPRPSMVFLVDPSESHNTQKLSPLSMKFQNATPKVPPITRGESL
jgi:hypothetical protein